MAHTTKENRDIYYRKAKEQGYRARSAYKLLQIFQSFHILYPILDEESALSILLNSSCSECEHELKGEILHRGLHHKYTGLFSEAEDSSSNSDPDTDVDHDFELKYYVEVKRSCYSLGRVKNVVDLCSAPGSWTQLLRNLVYHDYNYLKSACERLSGGCNRSGNHCSSNLPCKQVGGIKSHKPCKNLVEYVNVRPSIVAIDLQQMAPIDGVHFLRGDITDSKVLQKVQNLFIENVTRNISDVLRNDINVSNDGDANDTRVIDMTGYRNLTNISSSDLNEAGNNRVAELGRNAQLITCDGAPDVSGLHETDSFLQSSLIKSALSVCFSLLDTDGAFICKTFFRSEDTPIFAEVCSYFDYCTIFKPPASRPSSFEHFIVAMGFKPLGHMLIRPSESKSSDIHKNRLEA